LLFESRREEEGGKTGVCVCARACKRGAAAWFRIWEEASRELMHTCFSCSVYVIVRVS
jgi:hypothetical protein